MIDRQGSRIAIKGSVNFGNVTKVIAKGLSEIESGASEIDLSKLESADSSAVSMMLEWLRAAKKRNRNLSFHNMSPDLQSLVRLYGLSGIFLAGESGVKE